MFRWTPRENDAEEETDKLFNWIPRRYSSPLDRVKERDPYIDNLYLAEFCIALPVAAITFLVFWFWWEDIVYVLDFAIPALIFGGIVGIAAIVFFLKTIKRKYGRIGWSFALYHTLLVLFWSGVGVTSDLIMVGNELFDFSTPTEHHVVVLSQGAYRKVAGGRRLNPPTSKYVRVKSWRSELPELSIRVDPDVYKKVSPGDSMIIATRPGAFGIEYHCR